MAETKRQRYEILRSQLENERSTFMTHWRDLSDYILPRRARFTLSDVNKGDRRNQKIIDSSASLAARTLRSGMMGGVTSPARPWFRLTTPDPAMAEYQPVKEWLHTVGQRITTTFLRSNLYNILPITYGDLGVFATSPISIEEDFDQVIRCNSFPVGSYMIAKDFRGRVNVFVRDFRMTVRQLVEQFGEVDEKGRPDWSRFSEHVRNQYERGQYETWIDVCHVIKPNEYRDDKKLESKYKKFSSCYFERGGSTASSANYLNGVDGEKFLSEKGYDYFPILCPRWEVTGEDVYGTDCPGMTALGDIKALQLMQKRKSQAIEKMVNPPMTGPTALRNSKASILPGDITFVDSREGQQGFRPAHEVNPRIQELVMDINEHQKRIQRAFYEDLFLMLANTDRRDITAREIDERHEEKLLALGPVLEQLNQDLLDPLIDNTFNILVRQSTDAAGRFIEGAPIPEPPAELQGMGLKVEYISIMAQAQKLVGIAGVERFAGFASQVAQVAPESLDKIDADQILDVYADMTSIPPGIVRSDEDVAALRAQRADAAAAQKKMEMIGQGAMAAKTLSQTDMSGENALTQIVEQAKAGQLTPMQ